MNLFLQGEYLWKIILNVRCVEAGKLQGDARMMPVNKIFTTGSEIIADICTNCGYILSLKVKYPEKFK